MGACMHGWVGGWVVHAWVGGWVVRWVAWVAGMGWVAGMARGGWVAGLGWHVPGMGDSVPWVGGCMGGWVGAGVGGRLARWHVAAHGWHVAWVRLGVGASVLPANGLSPPYPHWH